MTKLSRIRTESAQYLDALPKFAVPASQIQFLYDTAAFKTTLIELIEKAVKRIYICSLYIENDDAGALILDAIYKKKAASPMIDIKIVIDWHRAQRGRIGELIQLRNIDFYRHMANIHPGVSVPIYGVPVNRRELLGVLHLKGFIFDDTVFYSGASINNVYLHMEERYRYDRYQLITQPALADSLVNFISDKLLSAPAVQQLNLFATQPKIKELRKDIRAFRTDLATAQYLVPSFASSETLSVTPLIGLGKKNALNRTILKLIDSTQQRLIICTPYFNLPKLLMKSLIRQLKRGKQIEIIVGDKTANDFFIPLDQPFHLIGGLPYLYELNLRQFNTHFQSYVDKGLLTIRLWKNGENSFHLKGIWVDDEWIMMTGNNLNPRAWQLDLENALLIHDPKQELRAQVEKELTTIREHTLVVMHYQQIQDSRFYPKEALRIIKRLRRIRIDKMIKRLL